MKHLFLKGFVITLMLCFANGQILAQGFLKKLKKSAESVTSTLSASTGSEEEKSDSVKALKWDKIPVYHAEKRAVTSSDGTALKNEDGTPKVRVFLVDQFGKVRSAEAVKEQHKKLNKAIGNILLKVGGGAAVGVAGGLLASKGKGTGALVGGAVGAGAGLLASKDDIAQAKAQKKSLKEQEKLVETYQKNFSNEGEPISASADVSKIKGIEITEGASMTSEETKELCASASYNSTEDDWKIES